VFVSHDFKLNQLIPSKYPIVKITSLFFIASSPITSLFFIASSPIYKWELFSEVLNLPLNTSSDFGINAFILLVGEKFLHHLSRVLDLNWLLKTSEGQTVEEWSIKEQRSVKARMSEEERRRQRKGAEKSRRR
jgi:hypothetical protein